MARKQKTEEATPLDEADRTLYSTFRGAANSLSQLYTQSVHHQALSFHADERHALVPRSLLSFSLPPHTRDLLLVLDKLCQWILSQDELGSRLTVADIATHIQNEMDFEVENPSTSSILEFQQQTQSTMHFMNSSVQPLFDLSSQASTGCPS
ncbi:hypothetical protein MUK42_04828 [Musa troglodytarum]|uniref:Uncharacterized protein n=1 Tax=Musa troglodytarum TaxID=320322 RepID=A0A9E7EFQ2_9LILI|nr:hypothetical protein MUK42_04828 [Musa troglodytarum]